MRVTRWKPLKSSANHWKTKTPPAGEAGGVLEKIDDHYQILNYLPASLVKLSFTMPRMVTPASERNPNPGFPIRTNLPAHCDHRVGRECRKYVLMDCMAAEESDSLESITQSVNGNYSFFSHASNQVMGEWRGIRLTPVWPCGRPAVTLMFSILRSGHRFRHRPPPL